MKEHTIGYGWVIKKEEYDGTSDGRVICDTEQLAIDKCTKYTERDLLLFGGDDGYNPAYYYDRLPVVSESPRKNYEYVVAFLLSSLEDVVLGGDFDFESTKDVVDLAFPNLIDDYFIP